MKINPKQAQLAAIAALFVAPIAVAWYLFFGQSSSAYIEGAHGVLAEPPVPLGELKLPPGGDAGTEAQLTGRWSFLYLHSGVCREACEQALIRMRQVRLALGKDAGRVQRLFVPLDAGASSEELAQAFPGMAVVPDDAPGRAALLERAGPRLAGEVLLVDPYGNLVLSYPPDAEGGALFRDTRHLLKLSKIG